MSTESNKATATRILHANYFTLLPFPPTPPEEEDSECYNSVLLSVFLISYLLVDIFSVKQFWRVRISRDGSYLQAAETHYSSILNALIALQGKPHVNYALCLLFFS